MAKGKVYVRISGTPTCPRRLHMLVIFYGRTSGGLTGQAIFEIGRSPIHEKLAVAGTSVLPPSLNYAAWQPYRPSLIEQQSPSGYRAHRVPGTISVAEPACRLGGEGVPTQPPLRLYYRQFLCVKMELC